MVRITAWTKDAKCLNTDYDLFDLTTRGVPKKQRQAEAERLCSDCPAMSKCAEHALNSGASGMVLGATWIPDMIYGEREPGIRLAYAAEHGHAPTAEEVTRLIQSGETVKLSRHGAVREAGRTMPPLCKRNHPIEGSNAYISPGHPNRSECRKCRNEGKRKARNKS
jgi:hypothetical protein